MILEGKTILVTGGTGSMGKTLVRRMLTGEQGTPRKIIVLSRDEAKQHDMRMAYLHKLVATDEVIYRNFMNVLDNLNYRCSKIPAQPEVESPRTAHQQMAVV